MIKSKSLKLLVFLFPLVLSGCSDRKIDQVRSVAMDQPRNEQGRFHLSTSPITVIDSVTGQVWRASGSTGGQYYFVRICYLASDGKTLMTTPHEESLGKQREVSSIQCPTK